MKTALSVAQAAAGLPFLGTRLAARDVRAQLEYLLSQDGDVVVDFSGIQISQSFADELIGLLLLRRSPEVLDRLAFKGCSDSVKAAIEFVVADRYDEFVRTRSH